MTGDVNPEIYAYGLRNPYRDSFDRETGTFYIADVGQDKREEINIGTAGANYGWREFEGTLSIFPMIRLSQIIRRPSMNTTTMAPAPLSSAAMHITARQSMDWREPISLPTLLQTR